MPLLRVSGFRCQFCHRAGDEVPEMVAGDSSFICADCIEAGARLLQATGSAERESASTVRFLFAQFMQHFAPLRPQELISTSRTYGLRQQADLQIALNEILGERVIPTNFVGIHQEYSHQAIGLPQLLKQSRGAIEAAPAQYEDVDVGAGRIVHCLKNGVWFLEEALGRYAVVLSRHDNYGRGGDIVLEVAVAPGESGVRLATRVFDAIEGQLSAASCYRGRILSLEHEFNYGGTLPRICVHELGGVTRDEVILPEETLRTVERNVLEFAGQRDALRRLKMSTQKGLLFHGPPGTGKTHCIRYLASKLEGHTTLLITAEGAGLLPEYISLARLLQPALVVLEDADLVARRREDREGPCDEAMLNRLLNEMDGLRERADVFFILTTNRPEALEPALANRPGRIDQAIAFPLPDASLRRRLIALYGTSLSLAEPVEETLVRRTDGASPAFIKELLRRTAQHHLDSGNEGAVELVSAERALHEMLFSGGALNTALLGGPTS